MSDSPVTLSVSVEGGKYTVVMTADGHLRALRHGEEWRSLSGDKLILALAHEVDDLRLRLASLTSERPPL